MYHHCLLILFAAAPLISFTIGDSPGICSTTHMVSKRRFVLDKTNGLKPQWVLQEYQFPERRDGCCANYTTKSTSPLVCEPVCDPPCEKAECMAPDLCVCFPGHKLANNSTTSCFDVCDSCVNGECVGDDKECTCFPGYKPDELSTHICDPVCEPPCENAHCKAPDKCECFEGFDNVQGVCTPTCSKGCSFGKCTAPEVCTCFEGYINDKFSPTDCLPVCNETCENGFCLVPGVCKCFEGFMPHPTNLFKCVPNAPENYSLSSCELKMQKAIKFDRRLDCFMMKDKVTINGTSDCPFLEMLSQPFCSQPGGCSLNKCISNFRCSMEKVSNSSKEMHCNLETINFKTENETKAHESPIIDGTEWSNVVLVVNYFQNITSSHVKEKRNQTREWTLRPTSKRPVCQQFHFGVELCPSPESTVVTVNNSLLNTSAMVVLNVVLIVGMILLVGIGIGGFFWARHRRLNNPLNYREDMVNGYYNKSYDNTPSELVADDEQDSDAFL